MSPSALLSLVIAAVSVSGAVFVVALRATLRDLAKRRAGEPSLPRAELHGAGVRSKNPWHRGTLKQRLASAVPFLQAGLVAMGVTSIFIMLLCMVSIFGVLIAHGL